MSRFSYSISFSIFHTEAQRQSIKTLVLKHVESPLNLVEFTKSVQQIVSDTNASIQALSYMSKLLGSIAQPSLAHFVLLGYMGLASRPTATVQPEMKSEVSKLVSHELWLRLRDARRGVYAAWQQLLADCLAKSQLAVPKSKVSCFFR